MDTEHPKIQTFIASTGDDWSIMDSWIGITGPAISAQYTS